MLIKGLIVIAAITCTACSNALPDKYDVYIDPAFDSYSAGLVSSSCREWESKVDATGGHLELNDTVEYKLCSSGHETCSNAITVHPQTTAWITSYVSNGGELYGDTNSTNNFDWRGDTHWGDIWIAMDAPVGIFPHLVKHELGHAMALSHTGPGTIMCGTYQCGSNEVMCADVEQWANLRGGQVSCR